MKTKKRVLFFINNFQIGGAHLQMTYLIRELKEHQFEPIICTHLNNEGGLRDAYYNLGVPIYTLARRNHLDFSILKKLKKIIEAEKVDIIVLFMPHNFVYYSLVNLFSKRKIYQVGLLRSMGFWLGHKNSLFKIIDNFLSSRFIKTSDIVIANSRAIKARYDAWLKLPEDRIKVVYNSSDFAFRLNRSREELRRELNVTDHDILVIMVARLDPWKDFDTLIKAAATVKERSKDFTFILCGGGELEKELKNKIAAMGLQKTVILLGEKNNVPEYINASDISVLTTKGEGFSNVIMESMALAKPVIATNVGGNSELIGLGNENGFLIEENDHESLADILLQLQADRKWMVEIGEKAKARIYELCNRQRNMDLIIQEFKNLGSARHSTP